MISCRENEGSIISVFEGSSYETKDLLLEKLEDKGENFEDNEKKLHNIRSLKCALQDFSRVYEKLTANDMHNIDLWLCSFLSYTLAAKSGLIAERGPSNYLPDSDSDIKKIYPVSYRPAYILDSVKDWISNGVWNNSAVEKELQVKLQLEKGATPSYIVRNSYIEDIDENILRAGFPDVVQLAYDGALSLNEYVLLILNYNWMQQNNFIILQVDWNKVKIGINSCIAELKAQDGFDRSSFQIIDKKTNLSKEATEAYEIIENFRNQDEQIYIFNKTLYIDCLSKRLGDGLYLCDKKRFNVFDEEMAKVTAYAFEKSSNSSKRRFSVEFEELFSKKYLSSELTYDSNQTVKGLEKLSLIIKQQREKYIAQNHQIALYHTNIFLETIRELILEHKSE